MYAIAIGDKLIAIHKSYKVIEKYCGTLEDENYVILRAKKKYLKNLDYLYLEKYKNRYIQNEYISSFHKYYTETEYNIKYIIANAVIEMESTHKKKEKKELKKIISLLIDELNEIENVDYKELKEMNEMDEMYSFKVLEE